MKISRFGIQLAVLGVLGILGARAAEVKHPRVLVTPERVALIRKKIQEKHPHFHGVYELMLKRAEKPPANWVSHKYGPCYRSRELAFLSLIAPDAADRKRFAEMAAKIVPDTGYIESRGGSKTLGYAMQTFGVALTYDWAYNEWTPEQRAKTEKTLEFCKQHWATNRRVSESNVTEYNFFGVLYGCRTMMWLALGEEKNPRVAKIADIMTKHLAAVGGELGAHGEGMGYTEYPGGFSLPAAYALAQHGYPAALAAAKEHAFWTLNMYVQTFMDPVQRKFLQYGVSHRGNSCEGMASLTLALCPKERLPGYLWFYDRHVGRLSSAPDDWRFDSHRGNSGFSMVCYPDGVTAKDPTGTLPKMVYDSHGFWFFRNRWKDKNDIQCAILGDLKKNHGWGQPEQLNIRLMAFDTAFIGGPGKERGMENYSTLLVDGGYAFKGPKVKGAHHPGRKIASEARDDGGYVIVGGGDFYQSMGVKDAKRHLLVKFSGPEENSAIVSTLDEITSGSEHTYTWQANIGPEGMTKVEAKKPRPNSDGVVTTSGTEAGRPYFLLTGRNGHVKGWVLHPADATIKTGDPLQIDTKSKDAKIWVVMHAAPGKKPAKATVAGEGMQSVLKIGGKTVRFGDGRVAAE